MNMFLAHLIPPFKLSDHAFYGDFDFCKCCLLSFQTDIEKLKQCSQDDSCDCKCLCSLTSLPWSNSFSRSFKQLSIARSPQVSRLSPLSVKECNLQNRNVQGIIAYHYHSCEMR